MTEEEKNQKLEKLREEYLRIPRKERVKLYNEYQKKRKDIIDEFKGITPEMRKLMDKLYEARINDKLLSNSSNEELKQDYKHKIYSIRKQIAHLKLEENKGKTR